MAFKVGASTVISDSIGVTSDNLVVDSSTLYVDSTNNRVGVDVVVPESTLSVKGNASIGSSSLTESSLELGKADSSSRGALYLYGAAPGLTSGGTINLYNAADYDANVLHYTIKASAEDFVLSSNADSSLLSYEAIRDRFTFDKTVRISTSTINVTPSVDADDLFLESTGNTGITIASGTNSASSVYFGEQGVGISRGAIVYDSSDDSMRISTAGLVNERVRIASSGRVGIGTALPAYPLHVASTLPGIRLEDNNTGTTDYTDIVLSNGVLTISVDPLDTTTNSILRFNADGNELARFKDGKFGIGTTNPSQQLHVVGNAEIERSVTPTLLFSTQSDSTSFARISFNDAADATVGRIAYSYQFDYMNFEVNGSERMRISSAGNLGIGTTSPTATLDVAGTASVSGDITTTGGNILSANSAYVTGSSASVYLSGSYIISSFSASTYSSADVMITAVSGNNRQVAKALITHDGSTAYSNVYSSVTTGSVLCTYTATYISDEIFIFAIRPGGQDPLTIDFDLEYTLLNN